jgi:hypothetical protein
MGANFHSRGDYVLAPIHLKPLLEIYCSPALGECPHLDRLKVKSPLDELRLMGLIEIDPRAAPSDLPYEPHGWVTTAKGRAYIEALLHMPLPVAQWVIPDSDTDAV